MTAKKSQITSNSKDSEERNANTVQADLKGQENAKMPWIQQWTNKKMTHHIQKLPGNPKINLIDNQT